MIRFRAAAAGAAFVLALGGGVAEAQWYQGPSGARGGTAYDGWVLNAHNTDIRELIVLTSKKDHTIQCVTVLYPNPPPATVGFSGAAGPAQCNVGNKNDVTTQLNLDSDEYILGISGDYTDHVNSLRFYTNKKNSPVYGAPGGGVVFGYTAPLGQMIVALTQANDTRLRSIGVMYAACDRSKKACK